MAKKIIIGTLALGIFMMVWLFNTEKKDSIDFNTQVRPILNKNCLACHGGVRQQSDLSFLFIEEALEPAKSGKRAIVPGRPGQSELIQRIKSTDPDVVMPPNKSPLKEEEVNILEQWIKEGAKFDQHWAYKEPTVQEGNIDTFIRRKLKKEELDFSPEAKKGDLLRRVSLDLIGLPPTPEDMALFNADQSSEAYEKQVDRLLSSPHFGERWTSMWLDLARYADSQGYQKDLIRREIWRYRDWLIYAFNEDMPFDQFTIEQLAGDLLENPSNNQLLATAFHRNTMTNDEGGTDDEEYRVAAVIDRVNTTFEIWQGTTMACVQCHSHPYDPIRQKEYYEAYAYFNNTADADYSSDNPKKVLFTPGQLEKKRSLEEEFEKIKEEKDKKIEEIQSAIANLQPGKVQVMEELPTDSSRTTRVFVKGNWLSHGDTVVADTPDFLPPSTYEGNRLGLAKWLVDGKNPLTARVIVNRFWEQLFGNGLVYTIEDFGTQGAKPTHPELLDYLALRFQDEHQWSIKKLLKEIVMSQTYRQSSAISEELYEKDRYNYLLARGPRFRLSAETIRDQALSISGLLNPMIYGPSVMPYQPDGVWNVIRHVDRWDTAKDGDQYRRGVYTFWRRVSPYPSMTTFDVPSREVCVSRRIRTNTPLQALVTLNDPVFVEAAEALAERMKREGGKQIEEQIVHGYYLATMDHPDQERLDELLNLYSHSEGSMTLVANVILNLDEVLVKS